MGTELPGVVDAQQLAKEAMEKARGNLLVAVDPRRVEGFIAAAISDATERAREAELELHVAELKKGRCICGNVPACVGRYEGHGPIGFGCDTCCGHGNEDGWCTRIVGETMA